MLIQPQKQTLGLEQRRRNRLNDLPVRHRPGQTYAGRSEPVLGA